MAKLLYLALLAAVAWNAYADRSVEDEDALHTTQSNQEIKCGKYYSQYPNFEDCSTYIVCQNGEKKIQSCPDGQHYNDQTIRCEEPCKAYCNKTLSCECNWATCGLDDACFQMKIVGPCRGRIQRYFFNKRAGECQQFYYSGCKGNENNFETLEECQQKCSKDKPKPILGFECLMKNGLFANPDNCGTFFQCSNFEPHLMACPSGLHFSDKTQRCEKPCEAYCDKSLSCECKWPTCGLDDLCFLPSEVGPCRAAFRNYYFNRRTGQCEKFIYGGCQGNKNNFKTKEECEEACSKDKPKPIPSFKCLRKNGLFANPDNCRTFFQCSNFEPNLMACPSGLHFSDKTQRCEKPCEAYCDKSLSCECKWPTCGLDDLCFLPPEVGPCRAGFRNYYFNRRTGQCEKFLYGGCRGNKNNFETKEKCEKACSKNDESPVEESFESITEEMTELPGDESVEQLVDESPELPEEDTLDSSFVCGPDDLYPHPKNCRSFVKCSKRVPTVMSCPEKLHFNNKTKTCETPCKAFCDQTYACKCKWPTCGTNTLCFLPAKPGSCKGKFERFYFNKRSGKCTSFVYGGCLGNENNFPTKSACERKCKHSLDICKIPHETGPCKGKFERYYFDHEKGKCQKFTYGGCLGNHNNFKTLEECKNTCSQRKRGEEDFICKKDGIYRHPESCSKYIHCVHGEKYDMPCPAGFHFNERIKMCLPASETQCELKSADGSASSCTEDGLFLDVEDCGRYINCTNGHMEIMSCPTGLHFNDETKKCQSPCFAHCDTTIECVDPDEEEKDPECAEDGKFTDLSSCNRYTECSNGRKSVKSCPYPLHFSEETKQCDSPCDARCDQSLAVPCGWPVGSEKEDADCPENEKSSLCGAACQRNCKNYKDWIVPCPFVCRPGCVCKKGFVRNSEGKCIPTEECDSENVPSSLIEKEDADCPENEHNSLCGAACQRNCKNYKDWIVPCPFVCRPGCVCNKGFVRNSEGKCIPTDECDGLKCQFPNGKFLYPADDRKYIKCEDDVLTIEECPTGHKFDYLQEDCV